MTEGMETRTGAVYCLPENPYSPMATWSLSSVPGVCAHLLELVLSCKSQQNVSESRVQLSTAKLHVNHAFSMNLTLCRLFDLFVPQFLLCKVKIMHLPERIVKELNMFKMFRAMSGMWKA